MLSKKLPPLKSKRDLDILLSGDWGSRLQEGIQLYRQGYAPYLLYTSSSTDQPKQEAIAQGSPPKPSSSIGRRRTHTRMLCT